MATKNMMYDHPAYLAVLPIQATIGTGSGTASEKFVAFTNMLVKSVTVIPTTAGTSNDVVSSIQISGTTTTTTAIGTFGSAATAFKNTALATAANLAQGDLFYLVKGTDATVAYTATFETVIVPSANVTA